MRLVYIAIGWSLGIILSANLAALPGFFWPGGALLAFLLLAICWRWPERRLAAVVLLAFTLGGLRQGLVPQTSEIARFNHSGGLSFEGVVVGEPDVRDERIYLRVAAESVFHASYQGPSSGYVLVLAPRTVPVLYGDRIRATGMLITPAEYDTFSYADFLARQEVFSIMENAAVQVLDGGHGAPFFSALLDVKQRAHLAINRALPEPQAGLLAGILLGNERGISPALADDFSVVGASHIIAISGFNMSLIAGMLMRLLERLTSRRGLVAAVSILVLACYTLLVGASAGVVRAAIMSSLLIIAPLLRRKTYVPASLAFVLLLMSLQNPGMLWDVSFQLSFFAVLGLALFVDPLSLRFDRLLARLLPRHLAATAGRWLQEPLVVTLAAQITTLPIIILHFQRLSLVSVLVNLLVIPVHAYQLIVGGLATILALLWPGGAQVLYWLELLFLSWSIGVVRFFAGLPFAEVELYIAPGLIGLYYVLLIGGAIMYATRPSWSVRVFVLLRQRAVLSAAAAGAAVLLVLMAAVVRSRPDGYLHVWLLDVGHHNAVLVQSPGGAQMLVDGGRFPSRLLTAIGDRLPFYDREIEVLVMTRPDPFAIAALPAVLARYEIGVALTNGQPNQSDLIAELETALARTAVVPVRAGYTLEFDDGLLVEVLHPRSQPRLQDRLGDHPVVLRLRYGEVSFLLTSSLSREGQALLLETQWPPASVLQLPQHGGTRSLSGDFLAAAQPQLALLQSDPANRLGDPDPDTLAMLGALPLFRTDAGGTLHLWTDGAELWVQEEG